jgi:hypothetical protein
MHSLRQHSGYRYSCVILTSHLYAFQAKDGSKQSFSNGFPGSERLSRSQKANLRVRPSDQHQGLTEMAFFKCRNNTLPLTSTSLSPTEHYSFAMSYISYTGLPSPSLC